jgi:hypothetical protein
MAREKVGVKRDEGSAKARREHPWYAADDGKPFAATMAADLTFDDRFVRTASLRFGGQEL